MSNSGVDIYIGDVVKMVNQTTKGSDKRPEGNEWVLSSDLKRIIAEKDAEYDVLLQLLKAVI